MATLLQISIFLVAAISVCHCQAPSDDENANLCADRMDKLKEFYCVSQCIGISEQAEQASAASKLAGKVAKIPAFNPGTVCSGFDFSVARAKECCAGFPEQLTSDAAGRADCGKQFGVSDNGSPQADYLLHKWQERDNSLEIGVDGSGKNLKLFCFAECLFSKMKWMTGDGKINIDMVKNTWKTTLGAKYTEAANAIDTCYNSILNTFSATTVTVAGSKAPCATAPFLLIQCVRKVSILTCPQNTGASAKCTTLQQNLRNCDLY